MNLRNAFFQRHRTDKLPFGEGRLRRCRGRRCTCARRAGRQSTAAHRQDLSPDRSAVREHMSMHSIRRRFGRTVTFQDIPVEPWRRRAARARLAGSPGNHLATNGRSAPRGALRPDVGGRTHANGKRTAERAEVRQEKCGDIHRAS